MNLTATAENGRARLNSKAQYQNGGDGSGIHFQN